MWESEYRAEQDEIKAPEFLKVKTLQKMKDTRNSSWNIFKFKPIWGLAVSCLVVMIVVLNWTNVFEREPELVTDLVFERLDGGLRYFTGIGNNDSRQVELKEAESMIGVSGSELYLEGFHLEDVSWVVEEDNVRIQYVFEQGDSSIYVMINNHTDYVATNSILNGFPLALYYRIMLLETTFIAEFLDGEIYYQIEVTGLTEEDFIDYLKIILNFFELT